MECCIVSCVVTIGLLLMAIVAWLKFVDADLTLLFKSKFGRSLDTLKGKVIWITGSSSGIGECLAYELSKVGARLVLSGTNTEKLNKVKENCLAIGRNNGVEVLVVPFNICDFECHEEQLKKVLERYGKLDILVNNAGRSIRAAFEEIPLQVDKELLDVNLLGPVCLTRTVVKHFKEKEQYGHVVVMSSTAGKIGAPFTATYTGSKHALQGYFECLRLESVILGGLDVTLICPGPVFSNIRERAFTAVLGKTYNIKDTPKSRLMETDRCAHLTAVAIANKMDEVWIAQNPFLLDVYLAQYTPSIFRNFIVKIFFTKERVQKMKESL